ncbi:MAG: polysaccharide deacetylase family protein [Treponema sp.]|nr:polysaccharide deacetylase family protein [Treponema sp.]
MLRKFVCILMASIALVFLSCNPDPGDNEIEYPPADPGDNEIEYPPADKSIAISFDDGPSGSKTLELLAILKDKKVTASFFLIGQNIRSNKASAQAIFNDGHELCNHSDGYSGLGAAAEDAIRTSLLAASVEIKKITGTDPVYFRAPNVAYGNNLTAVCTELGMAIIGVSVWSNDYQSGLTAEQVKNNVLAAAKDGGIINCHDPNTSGAKTLAALPDIIDGLRKAGYWIMPVGQLAAKKGKTLQAGTQYDSIN